MVRRSNQRSYLCDKNAELELCGPIKTVMMLLIVLYHSCALYTPGGWFSQPAVEAPLIGMFALWLNSFHVTVFVFVSGYIYSYLKCETNKYRDIRKVLSKKIERLIIPYLFTCLLWAAPFYIFYFGLSDVVYRFVLGSAPSQLWFLLMLFGVFVVFEILWRTARGWLLDRPLPTICVFVTIYFGSFFVEKLLNGNYFQICSVMQYLPIFYLGFMCRLKSTIKFWNVNPIIFLVVEFVLFVALLAFGDSLGYFGKAVEAVLLLATRIAGVAMVIGILGRTAIVKNSAIRELSKSSFPIFLFHQQIIWIAISLFNGVGTPPLLLVLASFLVSFGLSLCLGIFLRRFRVTRFLVGG